MFYIKYKAPTNHWAGHSLMIPIDIDKLFNIMVTTSELEYSLNDDDTIDASVVLEG